MRRTFAMLQPLLLIALVCVVGWLGYAYMSVKNVAQQQKKKKKKESPVMSLIEDIADAGGDVAELYGVKK